MSEQPEHDEQEQGGQVVPFPGTAQLPDVPVEAVLEPAPEPLEGEIVDEEEYSRRKGLQRYAPPLVVVQRIVVVVTTGPRTASTARATLRAGVSIGQGVRSWTRRGYDAATLGVYRHEIAAARAAGNHERLVDWTTRHQEVKQQRHQRLMDAPKLAVGVGIVTAGALVGLVVVVVLIALVVQVSGAGEFLGVIHGVLDAVRWVIGAVPVTVTVALVAGPPLVALAAWREGRRVGTAPRWLVSEAERAEADSEISPDLLAAALAHVKIPALMKFLKAGGRLEFVVQPREQGGGTYTQIRLPMGVIAAELLTTTKVELLAGNLGRHRHETWPQRQPDADARVLDLWVADKGTMDRPAPPWPLVHEGEFDVFRDRLPWGVTMRSEQISVGMLQKHWLVGATSKQGKTTTVRLLVLGLALDPTVELHIADLKGDGDWSMFRPRALTLIEGSSDEDAEATASMLEWAVAEMRRRYDAKQTAGIVGNITREVSRRPGSGFHPVWVIVDECQVLYGAPHPVGGVKDDARAWRAAKRLHDQARAVNVHLMQATQRPDNRTLPVQVREGAHVRAALNVPNEEAAKMILADAADRGARPQDLRPGADAGTVVATGEIEDIPAGQAFVIARTHYVSTKDAYPVIERAMAILHRAGRTVAQPDPEQIEAPAEVDHLADIAVVLRGERRVRTQVVLARLIERTPAEYESWDLPRLTAVLKTHHADPIKSGGSMFVDADRVALALTERDRDDDTDE
jgi:S-DNA-T family DNA segregation ATPase FtsK/SpoIIIE